MSLHLLWQGLIIGFAVSMPVGPIGILCIQRTLTSGYRCGLAAGLGAALADSFYSMLASLSLSLVAQVLTGHQACLRLIGGVVLCALGYRIFYAPSSSSRPSTSLRAGLINSFVTTFFLTLANPMTILAFSAIYAGIGWVGGLGEHWTSAVLVCGVFLGSLTWWVLLISGVRQLRQAVTIGSMAAINKISGAIIFVFGVMALVSLLALRHPSLW